MTSRSARTDVWPVTTDRRQGRWFALVEADQPGSAYEPQGAEAAAPQPLPDLITIVLHDTWRAVGASRGGRDLAQQVLPEYLPKQRWFGAKDLTIEAVRFTDAAEVRGLGGTFLLAELEVALRGVEPQCYLLPFAVTWGEEHLAPTSNLAPYTLAKARRGPRLGALHDATFADGFARVLVQIMHDEAAIPWPRAGCGHGRAAGASSSSSLRTRPCVDWGPSRATARSSSTSRPSKLG